MTDAPPDVVTCTGISTSAELTRTTGTVEAFGDPCGMISRGPEI
ncbi:MAG: hypothetical protein WDO73_08630 [Ignavibacteriota bacterium]